MKFFAALLALLFLAAPVWADSSFVAPSATGQAAAGQIPGTATNDSATAGNVGEVLISVTNLNTSTVTISNASPGVISWTTHGLNIGSGLNFTTSGGLPTGLSVGTNYYVCTTGFGVNSFSVATSVDNAFAGTCVNTSSAGSGTHTAISEVIMSNGVALNVAGIQLTAGDWDVSGVSGFDTGATTSVTFIAAGISPTSITQPSASSFQRFSMVTAANVGFGGQNSIPVTRISLSATTTYYLVQNATFTLSTMGGFGKIFARRRR